MKLFFCGDFCSKPSTRSITVSDELRQLIQSCDIKVVNFEVPLKPDVTMPPQRRERFYQNDDTPDFLRNIGFNVFSLANNHTFDWGIDGFEKTKTALGDTTFGAGSYEEAFTVKVMTVLGLKIGFLGFTFAAYTGVFDDVLHHEGLGCAYINDLKVNHTIMKAKKEVDYLFILPHDGIEYIDIPMPETIARYRDFIDYGADGVIGSHPHCPQGWEIYKGKPIFYSLGNFLFNSKENYDYRATRPHWYEGLGVILNIDDRNMTWDVISTKNVGNLFIDIDHNEKRIAHNEKLCNYIHDKEAYMECFNQICTKQVYGKEMKIIDYTFHSSTLGECTKLLMKDWIFKIIGKDFTNDYPLMRLLTHDGRKNLMKHAIKHNIKNQ
ncbi:MAG: CapA family protein [Prevotella sp.]|nr:CapA family protein [Prevotella sp.]